EERLGERDDAGLRDVVGAHGGRGEQPSGAGHVQDVAAPALGHGGPEVVATPDDAHEVHVHLVLPLLDGDLAELAHYGQAGVVHEDVGAVPELVRLGSHGRDPVGLAHVDLHGVRV